MTNSALLSTFQQRTSRVGFHLYHVRVCGAAHCPSSCHFKTGLLQCSNGQPFHTAQLSLCRWSRTWQHCWSSISQRGPTSHLSWSHSTDWNCCKNQIWSFDVGFQDSHWTRTLLLQCTPTSYSYRTRGALMFIQKKGQSHFPKPSHSAPLWWNELPTSIRSTETITTFKKQPKTHIFLKHSTTLKFRHLEGKVHFFFSVLHLCSSLFSILAF